MSQLQCPKDQAAGDIDVVAEIDGTVFVRECKDLSFARTITELVEQLGRFRARLGLLGLSQLIHVGNQRGRDDARQPDDGDYDLNLRFGPSHRARLQCEDFMRISFYCLCNVLQLRRAGVRFYYYVMDAFWFDQGSGYTPEPGPQNYVRIGSAPR